MIGPDGRDVTGTDHCRCSPLKGCGEWFNSTYAFDLHRTGKHGVDRRCLSPAEMLRAGMSQNQRGYWVSESMAPEAAALRQTGDQA